MNSPDGTAALEVITVSQLLNQPTAITRSLLVTQIEQSDHLQAIVSWLDKHQLTHLNLTLISTVDSASVACKATEWMNVALPTFPLQAYIPAQQTQTAIALQNLIDVVAQLRHPEEGCPWDLEQTPETLIPYIIEEAYETVDAIRQGEPSKIAEELGDLLLQVVLQTQIASETQQFSLTEVADGIAQKLIRRHPHVFGDLQLNSSEEVHLNWEKIKAVEQGKTADELDLLSEKLQRYVRRLPPLMAGLKLSEKAAAAGFEWPDMDGVWAKFYEELSEFQEALLNSDPTAQEAELGDLLFTLVNLARWCQIDPSTALHLTNQKLIARISAIESIADKPLLDYTPDELDNLWRTAKQQLSVSRSVPETAP
ncbi:MAG TPA: nucleoside triphosphate pyrophosphohydrolase [Stenomitos sp.]